MTQIKSELSPKDLRIGNYLTIEGNEIPMKVEEITHLSETWFVNDVNIDWCFGIPLSEGILLKAGFGKSEEHELGHNINPQFGFYYDWHFKRFYLDCESELVTVKHIQYLHQLQNLFWVLTNEELTITL